MHISSVTAEARERGAAGGGGRGASLQNRRAPGDRFLRPQQLLSSASLHRLTTQYKQAAGSKMHLPSQNIYTLQSIKVLAAEAEHKLAKTKQLLRRALPCFRCVQSITEVMYNNISV